MREIVIDRRRDRGVGTVQALALKSRVPELVARGEGMSCLCRCQDGSSGRLEMTRSNSSGFHSSGARASCKAVPGVFEVHLGRSTCSRGTGAAQATGWSRLGAWGASRWHIDM